MGKGGRYQVRQREKERRERNKLSQYEDQHYIKTLLCQHIYDVDQTYIYIYIYIYRGAETVRACLSLPGWGNAPEAGTSYYYESNPSCHPSPHTRIAKKLTFTRNKHVSEGSELEKTKGRRLCMLIGIFRAREPGRFQSRFPVCLLRSAQVIITLCVCILIPVCSYRRLAP